MVYIRNLRDHSSIMFIQRGVPDKAAKSNNYINVYEGIFLKLFDTDSKGERKKVFHSITQNKSFHKTMETEILDKSY